MSAMLLTTGSDAGPPANRQGAAVGVKLRARTGGRNMLVGRLLAAMTLSYLVDHYHG